MKKPVTLIIMDGYGLAKPSNANAISMAKKPNLDRLFKTYPSTTLKASGEAVGLPDGQMGNSEVGHMNIGAGRIVYQSLTRVNVSIKENEFSKIDSLNKAIDHCILNDSKFHVFGLCSDGGVHSHTTHIIEIIKTAQKRGLKKIYYHAFLDGRDVSPKSACTFLENIINQTNVKVSTVGGRYYAMDRDKNYDRIQIHYDAMTRLKGQVFENPIDGILNSYQLDVTDEFVVPFISDINGQIESNDSVVFANFRPDRAIEIATSISNPKGIVYSNDKPYLFDNVDLKNICFVSMMHYSDTVKGEVMFKAQSLDNLFADVLQKNNKTQLRIAETEKYAHVTFFFDGGKDREIEGSKRVLVNSPKVATYDLQPQMSAYEVTDLVVESILNDNFDCIILNYANCDMVGHTGVIPASIKAVEVVDECVGRVVEALEKVGGIALITADHGNCEKLLDEENKPFTAHTSNKVPLILTSNDYKLKEDGILCDLAVTMLDLLEIEKPEEMTAKSLLIK